MPETNLEALLEIIQVQSEGLKLLTESMGVTTKTLSTLTEMIEHMQKRLGDLEQFGRAQARGGRAPQD